MTQLATFATFKADLPDDGEFSRSGEIITPAGRVLSGVLTRLLEIRGFKVNEWTQHEFYGWQVTVELDSKEYWILLQGGKPWLLIIEMRPGLLGWLQKREVAFKQVLTAIDSALKTDERVMNVSWFTREEYEKGSLVGRLTPYQEAVQKSKS